MEVGIEGEAGAIEEERDRRLGSGLICLLLRQEFIV